MMVRRLDSQKLVRNIIGVTLFILFIGYGVYGARKVIAGPEIIVSSPTEVQTLEGDELLTLEGTTENVTTLTANGRIIYIDEKGNWNERLMLPPGYTIITLVGKDRFGNETTEKIEVMKKGSSLGGKKQDVGKHENIHEKGEVSKQDLKEDLIQS